MEDSSENMQEYFIETEESLNSNNDENIIIEEYEAEMELSESSESVDADLEGRVTIDNKDVCNNETPEQESVPSQSSNIECNKCQRVFKTSVVRQLL